MPDNIWHEVVGVIHIHSNYSDGTKTIEEIAAIGDAAGLDFLMFTDHMTLQSKRDGLERFYGRTAAIIGYEIEDPRDENHYLAFGLDKELPAGLPASEYVRRVRELGGLGIIAHPDEIRNAIPKYPSYPWNAWDVDQFDGIEIWNHMSAWMELLKRVNMLKMLFTPRRGLRGPTSRVLEKWDDLAQSRNVAGIGSADVHAHAYRKGPIKVTIFPYKVQFRSIRTHLLIPEPFSEDFDAAKCQVLEAIRLCRVFVSNFRWGDARGFQFFAVAGDKTYLPGDCASFKDDVVIRMRSPHQAQIRLIDYGRCVMETHDNELEFRPRKAGLYRIELHRKGRGWIYSNHIRII
jgi:hypothetical protein